MIVVTIERKEAAAEGRYNNNTIYSQVIEEKININELIVYINNMIEDVKKVREVTS